jgi:hypothetical protein
MNGFLLKIYFATVLSPEYFVTLLPENEALAIFD